MTEEFGPDFEVLPQPAKPRRSMRMLATVGAVVVLAGGGVATYAAFAGDDPGSNSPKAAVAKVIDDLSHSDLLGVIDDLAPGERDAVRGAFTSDVASLKRLGVLSSNADASSVAGVTFAAHDLSYATPVPITDTVQVVPITGGSFDMSASLAKLPLTSHLLDLAKGSGRATTSQHETIDAAKPVRIAAQQVGGRWYASIFYTAADEAAHHAVPSASDHIPAQGASSAQDAVRAMLTDVTSGKVRDALALISPAELGALHDYGGMFADKASSTESKLPVSITTLDLDTQAVDGGTEVTIKKLAATFAGQQVTVEISQGCMQIDSALFNRRVCGADLADMISGFARSFTCARGFSFGAESGGGSFSSSRPVHPPSSRGGELPGSCQGPTFSAAQKTALAHLFAGLLGAGVVTTQEGGKWYVAPVRTLAHLSTSTLSALQGNDLFELASLGH